MSFRPRALSRLQVEGEHKRVSPDPSTTSGYPIWSNGFNGSVRRMGRKYEKYIEIFTVGTCWLHWVTSSYLLVMLIWPPKDEPKRGSVPGGFVVISDWNVPCPAGPHRAPPGPTWISTWPLRWRYPAGFGEVPRLATKNAKSDAIRQRSHVWQVWQVTFIFSKIFKIMLKIMSHHVSLFWRCKRWDPDANDTDDGSHGLLLAAKPWQADSFKTSFFCTLWGLRKSSWSAAKSNCLLCFFSYVSWFCACIYSVSVSIPCFPMFSPCFPL